MAPELVGAFIAMVVPLFFSSGMILARVGLVNVPPATGNFVSRIAGSVVGGVVALSLFVSHRFVSYHFCLPVGCPYRSLSRY